MRKREEERNRKPESWFQGSSARRTRTGNDGHSTFHLVPCLASVVSRTFDAVDGGTWNAVTVTIFSSFAFSPVARTRWDRTGLGWTRQAAGSWMMVGTCITRNTRAEGRTFAKSRPGSVAMSCPSSCPFVSSECPCICVYLSVCVSVGCLSVAKSMSLLSMSMETSIETSPSKQKPQHLHPANWAFSCHPILFQFVSHLVPFLSHPILSYPIAYTYHTKPSHAIPIPIPIPIPRIRTQIHTQSTPEFLIPRIPIPNP